MLRNQMKAFTSTGGAYSHATNFMYLLHDDFGTDSTAAGVFAAASVGVAAACEVREQLCVLNASPAAAAPAGMGFDDDLIGRLAGFQLGPGKAAGSQFLVHGCSEPSQARAAAALVRSMEQACSQRHPFSQLKVALNFGGCCFYRARPGQRITLEDMRAGKIGGGNSMIKTVFSNGTTTYHKDTLPDRLAAACTAGTFVKEVGTRRTVSCHIVHQRLSTQYGVSMVEGAEGGGRASRPLVLRKVKHGTNKLTYVTLLTPSADQQDARLRLLGVHNLEASPGSAAAELADILAGPTGARLEPGASGHRPLAVLPTAALAACDMVVERIRAKTKQRFTGNIQTDNGAALLVEVSFKTVVCQAGSGHGGRAHVEVSVRCPQLNELLSEGLAHGEAGPSAAQQRWEETMARALLAFAWRVVDGAHP